MANLAQILGQLDRGSQQFTVEALATVLPQEWVIESIAGCARQSVRQRRLPAVLTLWLVILLGLFRRKSYVELLEMLLEQSRWAHDHWAGDPPSTAALTQARDRLGVEPAKVVFEFSAPRWKAATPGLIYCGLRVHALDGTTFKTPDSHANRAHFGAPGSHRGRSAYPQMRVLTLLDVGSRQVVAVRHGPYATGEMTLAGQIRNDIPEKALVLLDRGFAAYEFLHDIRTKQGAHFLVRIKNKMNPRVIANLGAGDDLVEVKVPRLLRAKRPDLPRRWRLRLITYRPQGGREDIRLLTSLLDPTEAPADELADLYHRRWEVETATDEQKTHLADMAIVNRAVMFRSKTPARVVQELYGLLLAHNLVRRVLGQAAEPAKLSPLRLSYTAGLTRLRDAVRDMLGMSTSLLKDRYESLLRSLARARVPLRPGRLHPREVKIKMSVYPCKKSADAA